MSFGSIFYRCALDNKVKLFDDKINKIIKIKNFMRNNKLI